MCQVPPPPRAGSLRGMAKPSELRKRELVVAVPSFTILAPAEATTWIFLYQTIKQGK